MDNAAIVVKINNIEDHSNADKLKIVKLFGTQIIVGLDTKIGDIAVYVDSNLKMSKEFLHANSEYKHPELNKDNQKTGFFDDSGRVKCIKLRGELSGGFLFPLSFLDFAGKHKLKVGDEFNTIQGIDICSKYAPIVQQGSGNGKQKQGTKKLEVPMFKEHFKTGQFMREQYQIPEGTVCYIEEKIHGTSHRTGYVKFPVYDELPWWKKILYSILKLKKATVWKYLNGTRRVIHTPKTLKEFKEVDLVKIWTNSKMEYKKQSYREFYYNTYEKKISDEDYRIIFPEDNSIHTKQFSNLDYFGEEFKKWWLLKDRGDYSKNNIGFHDNTMREEVLEKTKGLLLKGEEVYLELFGHEKTGKQIQKGFPYSTEPSPKVGESYRSLLYRVTMNNEDGHIVDYNREAVYDKAKELGMEVPHLFEKFYYTGSKESMQKLETKVIAYAQGQSALGMCGEKSKTLKEGVVIWFINSSGHWKALKYKSDAFRLQESSGKDKGVVDQEDIN